MRKFYLKGDIISEGYLRRETQCVEYVNFHRIVFKFYLKPVSERTN